MDQQSRTDELPRTASIERSAALSADREAGAGMHFTSLAGPYGTGDIGDSAWRFVDTLSRMNFRCWQFLPTGPTAYGDSPYQPLSAFAGNEMLIGIDPLVKLGLLDAADAKILCDLSRESVDYGKLIPRKRALLERAALRFQSVARSELKTGYEEFLHQHSDQWLDEYAIYRVLKTAHAERPWPEWDSSFVHREPAAIQKARYSHRVAIEHNKIIQFLFDQQWQALKRYANERNVRLFGDMPIYIALDSSDAWAHPEILLINEDGRPSHVAGVPPDYFSEDGQLWGNPLYDWSYHKSTGFQWWIERMRHALDQLDLVRIDHFRGFEAYWSVAFESSTARGGEWMPGPGSALFESMESVLGEVPIVAEDLGIITPAVDDLRYRHQIPGMKVLQFEVADTEFDPQDMPAQCVCYTGTHDNDTTAGWFNGGDQDTRSNEETIETQRNVLKLTGGTAKTIHLDMVRLALNSPARLAIAPMQDFLGLGSEARMNVPGTTLDNWRWRVVEEQLAGEFCESVADIIGETRRA